MQLALDDDEVELLLVLIDINLRALRTTIESNIGPQERAIHGVRFIHLQRIRTKLAAQLN